MTTILSLPTLSKLKFHPDKNGVGLWIPVSEWINFIRDNLVPEDKFKDVRRSNLLRDLKKGAGNDHLLIQGGETWMNFAAVVWYAYSRQGALQVCRSIAKQVEACLLTNTKTVLVDNVIVQHDKIWKRRNSNPTANQDCSADENEMLVRREGNEQACPDDEETIAYCGGGIDRSGKTSCKSEVIMLRIRSSFPPALCTLKSTSFFLET